MKDYPVISRASIAAAVTAIVTLLHVFGVEVTPDLSVKIVDAILAVIPVASIVWAAYTAHKRVSPVEDAPADPVVIPMDAEPVE